MKNPRSLLLAALLSACVLAVPAAAPAARGIATPASDPGGWSWPLAGIPVLLAPFDKPEQRWSAGHRGVDLGAQAPEPVLAPAPGIVSFIGKVVDRPVLVLDHGSGLLSSFEPVASELSVGAVLGAGDRLGIIAGGAHCDGRCLHWGLRLDGEYIDPMLTIHDDRPSILLPLKREG